MPDPITVHEKELQQANGDEKGRLFIHNAIELALSLGDFQKEVGCQSSTRTVVLKAAERIEKLIEFEASGIYLVEEGSADLKLAACTPIDAEPIVESESGYLIENGSVAWAIRERRGISLYSENAQRQIFLHVMSTCSRIRGLFIGIFPAQLSRLPDASLEILSIILRNASNCIESLHYSNMLRQEIRGLEISVEEKNQRLLNYEKQLLQTQHMETIAKLAGGIAHQFNNALTSMIGYLDLASMSVKTDSKAGEYIENIRPVTERLCYLTNNLLSYAQGGQFILRTVSMKEILQDVRPAVQRLIKDSVSLSIELVDESISVEVDSIQFRMVILAVVENANEAIEDDGKITISAKAVDGSQLDDDSDSHGGNYLRLSVRDSGRGMDQETARRIFEPFFSTKFEGRGLSMAAVFGIIKNHKGWIKVHSKIDQGTQVDIYLPLAPEDCNRQ